MDTPLGRAVRNPLQPSEDRSQKGGKSLVSGKQKERGESSNPPQRDSVSHPSESEPKETTVSLTS